MKRPPPQPINLYFVVGPRNTVAPYYGCTFRRSEMKERLLFDGVESKDIRIVKMKVAP